MTAVTSAPVFNRLVAHFLGLPARGTDRCSGGRRIGVRNDLSLNDPRAARALRRRHELPGHRLFRYMDDAGATHPIASGDVNSLLEELTGRKLTAKDFRTALARFLQRG
jgi:DNA topoisomerase IB